MSNPPTAPAAAPSAPPAPAAPPSVEMVSASMLNGELPPVNENAIRAMALDAAPAAAAEPGATAEKDKLGRAFDAAKFRPEKDSLGRWKNLRGGRKSKTPGTTPPTPAGSVVPERFPDSAADAAKAAAAAPVAPVATGPDVHDLTAEAYLRAGYATADTLVGGGGECQPDDAAEHAGLKSATAAWLRTRQSEELSPGYAFALALGSFVLKRLRRPRVAAAIVRYFPGLADFLGVEKPKTATAAPTAAEKPAAPVAPRPAAPAPDPFGGLSAQQ